MAESFPLVHLVSAARRQEASAWNALLASLQLPLYAYVAELLGDREAARDVLQDSFLAAVRHIGSLREDARFVSWLYGIAHQKCLQHFRRRRRDRDWLEETPAPEEGFMDESALNGREQVLEAEDREAFFAHLATLPAPQRATLLLHILESFSLEEIARVTEVPLGTVKSRLYHAKRNLRAKLEAKP